ncbi:nicotinate-nucleotide--dimethylbenzimidazole phosphoribosyltransferase [Caulobacter segnis]|uniref:nicotinate-nucleotide--dimethylbenzimidazole phosphoribosyltransferase n=1 Tax=Caulobacter segnis TaxID=88688 RepID=UPI00240F1E57|nr:nicotinate-nucleotide--dimethylbenzimidazole phosphoribosyltransferase [Caulobacter segnis]MDG2521849.1 nicotinate-nucleotide--dimethylbenzimidazole phosphoribosyltransferase [Caulobacter segnis]
MTIKPLDLSREPEFRALIDGKAKPPGSLGRIEDLAVQLALIADRPNPDGEYALLLVFAGDHGLTESGVSAYPSAVTTAMVATFLADRASASAFARAAGAKVRVVDAGVASDLPPHERLIDAKVRKGTRNAAVEPALTPREVEQALEHGARIARDVATEGFDILMLGEMGIGNTASAALLMHRLAPAPLEDCIGQGTGHTPEGMARKRDAIQQAADRSAVTEPLDVLAEFGGLEIVMMVGAILGAAEVRRPVVVDGFICTAAALAAVRIAPAVRDYLIFAHRSAEHGHALMLEALEAKPLLDLDLRLGEGTGALLALPVIRAAARLLTDVASLDDVMAGRL